MQRYKSPLTGYKSDLIHHPTLHHEIWPAIDHIKAGIYAGVRAVNEPNGDATQEVAALRRLVEMQYESAPQVFKLMETKVQPDMQGDGIVGSYVFIILMSKVPGARLLYKTFCTMSRAQRDIVREAFRQALM
jgi:hypothetical protein